jgi:NodT family efflux transporter outer membrane factor (OMF) lipoprotein
LKNTLAAGIRFAVLLLAVGLSACFKAGPDYVKPDASVSPAWRVHYRNGLTAGEADREVLASWWTALNDPVLSGLIKRAAAGSIDLKTAEARVREARARRGLALAEAFPTLDASGKITRSRSTETAGVRSNETLYAAGFDAAWELDIFGGVRRSVEAADASLDYSREDRRDVLVTLTAEVALNYVDVRTYQARIAVAEANLASQSETWQLTVWRKEAGLSDDLAVQQARYNLENTRAQIPVLRASLSASCNRIAVLLGEQPGTIQTELAKAAPIPAIPAKIAVGVPADLLRRRPDIRKAERNLAAQTAKIGVAAADLYPKFKLAGSIGLQSLNGGDFFSSASSLYSFGPSVSWRIFDAGAVRRNIDIQTALQEQAFLAWQSAVLGALEEVENVLASFAEEQDRRRALVEATNAAQEAAKLARLKYESGLADFTNVLEAERSVLTYQEQLTQSEGAMTANLIRLYKRLGGGWDAVAEEGGK